MVFNLEPTDPLPKWFMNLDGKKNYNIVFTNLSLLENTDLSPSLLFYFFI